MALTDAQVRTMELGALGLPPNATADQINARLRNVTPGTLIDNRTGLPYTRATAKDAGADQAAGQIVGGAALGLTLGEIAAGLSRLGIAVGSGETAGGSAAAGAGEAGGATGAGTGAGAGAAGTTAAANVFKAAKFASVAEFLTYIAWIMNPHTLLRAVEFVVGILIGAWGVYLLTGGSRSGAGVTARRIIHLTPAGRTIRMAEGRRMGRREGQREAARMEARQRETLSQREASARERVRINRDARQA